MSDLEPTGDHMDIKSLGRSVPVECGGKKPHKHPKDSVTLSVLTIKNAEGRTQIKLSLGRDVVHAAGWTAGTKLAIHYHPEKFAWRLHAVHGNSRAFTLIPDNVASEASRFRVDMGFRENVGLTRTNFPPRKVEHCITRDSEGTQLVFWIPEEFRA